MVRALRVAFADFSAAPWQGFEKSERSPNNFSLFQPLAAVIVVAVQVLFRTEKDGPFTNEDMFYLQAIGMHLNAVLYQITHSLPQTNDLKQTLARLKNTCHLTNRELQIAEQIYQYRNNDEIAGSLGIRENTLQKHLQNIFRKTNVTSRWELLRFRMR